MLFKRFSAIAYAFNSQRMLFTYFYPFNGSAYNYSFPIRGQHATGVSFYTSRDKPRHDFTPEPRGVLVNRCRMVPYFEYRPFSAGHWLFNVLNPLEQDSVEVAWC